MWWGAWNNSFNGDEFGRKTAGVIAPPPEEIEKAIRVRLLVGDPEAPLIGFCDELPDDGKRGLVYTTGDGSYWTFAGKEEIVPEPVEPEEPGEGSGEPEPEPEYQAVWSEVITAFHDAEILGYRGGVCEVAKRLIVREMGAGGSSAFITSFTAGGQSTTFASVQDLQAHLGNRLKLINSLCGSSEVVRGRRVPVGGSYE